MLQQVLPLRSSVMDVPPGFNPTLILVLNLAGTFVFGVSGGLAAVRARLDLLGVVVLATVVALAGGITRDLLIGTPPATVRDWRYLAAAGLAGLVCFFAGSVLERFERSVMVFDAVGLSLFAVTGATTALQFGLGPVQAVLLGTVTGVGSGCCVTCCSERSRPSCVRGCTRCQRCWEPPSLSLRRRPAARDRSSRCWAQRCAWSSDSLA